ncbi:LLM class flavin-dependent oxidoreductase [Pseudomonas sp. PDM15]|uniref:LLM class flavin-dependent oxidoreductase n=1 Tax=Pseudomonas sp. PDM15 TaxID=2769303 RepID=UPI0017873921|nr:LLM class flavin-dependent oxidoreductase [Pseudomonas sp. PDM15]MBD9425400.1 LLM class flavin-dependent oxidoreductase [Pseudomonas sp. PDM15]
MSVEFIWELPNWRDSRYADASAYLRGERHGQTAFGPGISDPRGERFNYLDYLQQIARAADLSGFDGIRIGNHPDGDEPWIIAGYVARSTRHLRLLTEFDAARGSAVYAAKNAVSYQRFSGGRFAWQLSTPTDAAARRRQGDFVADADLLPRIDEFIGVARGVITQAPFSFKGRFFEVLDGGFQGPLAGQRVPPIYLAGDDAEALQLSARQADVHVFSARPSSELAPLLDELSRIARAHGRAPEAGLRLDLLAREDAAEALADAQRLATQAGLPAPGGSGLWQPGGDSVATLIGSYAEVIEWLAEYAGAGIGSFLIGAAPHLEEAYRVGENVLPALRARLAGATAHTA